MCIRDRNIIMDTLLNTFKHEAVKVVGYADDILLMVVGPDKGILIDLMNTALEKVLKWGNENGLTFNPQKTMSVLFTRRSNKGKKSNQKLMMDGTEVKVTNHMK